jgi:hypothetical protein
MALPCGLLEAIPSRNTRDNSLDMSSCAVHMGRWDIPSRISVLIDKHIYPFSDKPKPTYPFSDKCPHRSTQVSHKGVRSGECLRKLQTSKLPLSEGGILFHSKSVMKVLELCPGKVFSKNICNFLICRKVLHQYCLPLHHVSDEILRESSEASLLP